MAPSPPQPARETPPQFSLGSLFGWLVLLCLALSFVRYAWLTHGVLTFIAAPLLGAAVGAPFGYLYGDDRVSGAILGGLIGGALGMLAAMLLLAFLVTATVR